MKYKRMMILAMLLVGLLAVGAVSAAENVAGDVVGAEDATDVIDLDNDDVVGVNDFYKENNEKILASGESQDNLSQSDEEVLAVSSPTSSDYSVSVSDITVDYESSGTIKVDINPCTKNNYYKYNFYLKIYNSKGDQKYSSNYYSSTSKNSISYTFSAGTYASGTYTVKIVNYKDNYVMDTATLTVRPPLSSTYPSYSDYSVDVSDIDINYGSRGSINMGISPSSRTSYKYYYYLKVYGSNGNEKISKLYSSRSSANSIDYAISSNQLSAGMYQIKIINYYDDVVMDTANLTVKSPTYPSYSDYSVTLSDTAVVYGSGGTISMTISPSSRTTYKYYYHLKVYDSNNNVKISEFYWNNDYGYSESYTLGLTQLSFGNYTMKIINEFDNFVMDTAKLTVKPSYPNYNDYSVSVSDTTIDYGKSGSISMTISPAYSPSYKYNYYLKVYDSNNNEKISKLYSGTGSDYSKTYSISSNQLGPGFYTIKIVNAKDNWVMSTAKLNIKKINLETQDMVGKCDGIIQYKVRANENGVYKSGLEITFIFNSDEYTTTTDNDGYATFKIHLKAGTYGITTKCENAVNENTIEVNKVYVTNKYKNAYVKSLTGYYKGKNIIKYGWKGNLEGYFKIYKGNKVIYQSKFNSNGYIDDYFKYTTHNKQHSLSKMGAGTYNAVITNSKGKAIAKGTIKIIKSPTHIKCASFVTKVGSKRSIGVYVYDKFNSRKGVAGAVQLKINGKTYNAKVKNGAAVVKNVKFPLKVKTYKGNVKFLANKNYKTSTKKFKVSARKLTSAISAYSGTARAEGKLKLVAFVAVRNLNGDTAYVNGGTVKFIINGGTYYTKISGGKAQITITAPYYSGKYSCKAIYLGSQSIKGSSDNIVVKVKPKPVPVVTFRSPTSGSKWTIKKSTWEKMKRQAVNEYYHMRSIGSSYPGFSKSINVKVTIDGYVYSGIAMAVKNDRSIRCEVRGAHPNGWRITNEGDY